MTETIRCAYCMYRDRTFDYENITSPRYGSGLGAPLHGSPGCVLNHDAETESESCEDFEESDEA